jgi:DNA-binding NtrC family response regulator
MEEVAANALLVMPPERRQSLLEHFKECNVGVLSVSTCSEMRQVLETGFLAQVVFTDVNLPDGNWRDILTEVEKSGSGADVVVCSRVDDVALWLEVLEHGCYDLLVEPYNRHDLQRIFACFAKAKPVRRENNRPSSGTSFKAVRLSA